MSTRYFPCPLCGRKRITLNAIKRMLSQRPRGARGLIPEWGEHTGVGGPLSCCYGMLSTTQLKSLWGAATASLRVTKAAGPGRPRSKDRCACGKWTKVRAASRGHVC